jgi:3'-5' exoribonuclease
VAKEIIMVDHTNIEDLESGESLRGFYLVNQKQIKKTRTGKDYIDLILQDSTGTVAGKIWDNTATYADMFTEGDIVKIEADVGEYQGRIDLNIKRVRTPLEEDTINLEDFLPVTPYDIDEMEEKVKSILKTIENPFLSKLVNAFLDDGEFMQSFRQGVASKIIHHPYLGGLLEHTLSMLEILDFLGGHYSGVNRDMLLTGGFFHDIGKLKELSSGPEMGYTDEGIMLGHMVLGTDMVREKIKAISGFPPELEMEVLHTVLSHQGELEWGSPVLPMTCEALIIHFIDNMDAKQFVAKKAVEESKEDGNFTSKIYPLNRVIYKGGKPEKS